MKLPLAACVLWFLVCVVLIFSVSCASSSLGRGLNVGVGVSALADQLSTDAAESRGGRELNRLMGDRSLQQWLVKSLGVGGVIGLAAFSEVKGHPITAQVIRMMAISAYSAAAWHNHRVMRTR